MISSLMASAAVTEIELLQLFLMVVQTGSVVGRGKKRYCRGDSDLWARDGSDKMGWRLVSPGHFWKHGGRVKRTQGDGDRGK